jgi:hypothetical protein
MKIETANRILPRKVAEEKGLPKAVWLQIDPERADEMLKQLDVNRKLVSNHVMFLAREMREGRWKVNGDTIRFSGKRLLDGQHRLHAIIQSGITVWVLVVEEIEDDAFDTIDTGRSRGAGDILSVHGFGHQPFLLAAAARFIWYSDNGFPLESSFRIANAEIVEIVRKHPILQFLCGFMSKRKPVCASPIIAGLALISRKVGREVTIQFADKLASGANLGPEDPIKFFRDKWLQQGTHRGDRTVRANWVAVLIKTYNAWAAGKKTDRVERYQSEEKWPDVIKPNGKYE